MMAVMNMYDMLREKAKSMGHAAAKLPDSVWQNYLDMQDDRAALREAKLYVENYMMGNLNPAEFARVMAEDDKLRYTISDLCQMRLEPVPLDIQRNNSYIDVGAGIKTFWTEVRVPLPSELDAARDISNINHGIEAARAVDGIRTGERTSETVVEESTEKSAKKRSFRDMLNDAKKYAAGKAIEKLTPIAEGRKAEDDTKTSETKTIDEKWLETEEGREYRDELTRQTAQQIENTVMNIEAGKNAELDPDERKKALKAAGMSDEMVVEIVEAETEELFTDQDMTIMNNETESVFRSEYSETDLNSPLNEEMEVLFDQILQHVSQDRTAQRNSSPDMQKDVSEQNAPRKGYVNGEFDGKSVTFKNCWSNHTFTQDEIDKLLAGETITFDYTKDDQQKTVEGKLEWQTYNGREYLGFKPDFGKKSVEAAADSSDSLSDDELMHYSMEASEQDSADMDDYYARLAEDMRNYQSEDSCEIISVTEEETIELSAEEVAAIFNNGTNNELQR